jgi:hypothetical protein
VRDIRETKFSKHKMACTENISDNNIYIIKRNVTVLFLFENRHVFLPHSVYRQCQTAKDTKRFYGFQVVEFIVPFRYRSLRNHSLGVG